MTDCKRIRFPAAVLALVMLLILPAGCVSLPSADDGFTVITTVFPAYDFTRQIAGEHADVSLLLPPGTESHAYEPTPLDIINIQNCDLFLCVGGESESWVDRILGSMDDGKGPHVLRMIDCVEAVEETVPDGAGIDGDHEEDHRHGSTETEYDEHVWTSPANARQIAAAIADTLQALDPENSAAYQDNLTRYDAELAALDEDFRTFFASHETTLVFGDRFPFRYFADAYGLTCYAAFPGCASETEPSAATVVYLIDRVRELGLRKVYYIEFSNHVIADTIARETGTETALFHSCHNVTAAEQQAGVTYISLMRANLAALS